MQSFFEQQRHLWNAALEQRITAYKRRGVSVSKYEQHQGLTELRQADPEFSQYDVNCQRSILNRLDRAFQAFFARVKRGEKPDFPRFKGRYRRVRSFEIPGPVIKQLNQRQVLIIKGIGKFRFKADSISTVKQARIVVTPCRVKVQLTVETPVTDLVDERPALGIDVGIKAQVTLSNGVQFPKRRRDMRQVKRAQRRLSHTIKGSNGRYKKHCLLAKAHQRVKERERGYLHELTRSLITHHSARFVVEALQITNMVKNHALARSIHEQPWGLFVDMLTYKAENAGGWVRRVNPRHTSQRCSGCGAMPGVKLTLADRESVCTTCGLVLDRDINAAQNVLQVGMAGLPGG